MISAVVSARLAGLDRIKSGFTSRFANRLPIFGASRLPRSLNGRSLSGNAVSSQLDFAWRMRNSVFMAVCIENLIRFDCVTESYNVGDDSCARVLLSGAVDLNIQFEEPARCQGVSRLALLWQFCGGRGIPKSVFSVTQSGADDPG